MILLEPAVRIQLQAIVAASQFGVSGKSTLGYDSGAWDFADSPPDVAYSVEITATANSGSCVLGIKDKSFVPTNATVSQSNLETVDFEGSALELASVVMLVIVADRANDDVVTIGCQPIYMPDITLFPGQVSATLYAPSDLVAVLSNHNLTATFGSAGNGDKVSVHVIGISNI